ncbi:HU family DNA-binding protein [Streptomyces sp. NRRL F-5755]|uniref:HU family DNA-binding protein n=1 Tax=Streptomyces sp. NRRL F-5755 TaxID=1519475 RepID=UPI000ABD9303
MRGDSVMVTNFGAFRRVRRERRSARNPQTGGRVTVPARNVVDFRVAPPFRRPGT